MRYFLDLEFSAEDDRHADAFLDFLQGSVDGGYRIGHGCVRRLEKRGECPECGEPLDLGGEPIGDEGARTCRG